MPYSLVMNGVTGHSNHGNAYNKAYNNAFSVSMWIKGRQAAPAAQIVGKRSFPNPGWTVMWNDTSLLTNCFSFALTTGVVSVAVRTLAIIQREVWQHFVVTYSGSGTAAGVAFYINGASTPKATVLDNLAGGVTTNALDFRIGCSASGAIPFNGSVSQVLMHSRSLTPAEVADLYYDGKDAAPDGQALMTDGAGSTLTGTGTMPNGTITTPVWSTNSPSKARVASSGRDTSTARTVTP